MKKTLLSLAVLLLGFVSCEQQPTGGYYLGEKIDETEFPKTVALEFEKIDLGEEHMLGAILPSYIDSIFIVRYFQMDSQFKLFNKKTHEYISDLFKIGNGPNEFTSILTFDNYTEIDGNGDLWAYFDDVNLKRFFKMNFSHFIKMGEYKLEDIGKQKRGYFNPIPISSTQAIYIEYNELSKKQSLLVVENYTDSVVKKINLSDYKFNYTFDQTTVTMCVNNDGTKVALASISMNQIIIIDLENDERVIFSTEDKLQQWDVIKDTYDPNSPESYGDIVNTGEYLIANYVANPDGSEFHVFDWDGNPIVKLVSPIKVTAMSYDKIDNMVYCSNYEDELFYKFDLNGVIYHLENIFLS